MRTWQELIEQATATGTYATYWGDGASVPWEDVVFPLDFLLYTYQQYLTRTYPQAFRLHDWCYTPLGALIQVTREEADSALFDMLALESLRDARIVYAAVRLGGAQYFGQSMTGITAPNMALMRRKASQVAIKVVVLFKDTTGVTFPTQTRVAGFSESIWFGSDSVADCVNALKIGAGTVQGLLPSRAALLPSSASIVGYKLYQGGAGRGQSASVSYPGPGGQATDVPNIALLMKSISGTTGATRRWWVHAIPDQFVVDGAFVPNGTYLTALARYVQTLGLFQFFSLPASPANSPIVNLTQIPAVPPATANTALVNVQNAAAFAANMAVTLSGMLDTNGNRRTFSRTILSVNVGANQVVVPNWTEGNMTGGTMRQEGTVASTFDPANTGVVRIGTRKVGRPFDVYRGRKSRTTQTTG